MLQNQNWIVGLETSSISCEGLRVNPSAHFLPQNGRTTHLGQGLPKSIALRKQSTWSARVQFENRKSAEEWRSVAASRPFLKLSAPPVVCSFPQNWKSNCPSAPQTLLQIPLKSPLQLAPKKENGDKFSPNTNSSRLNFRKNCFFVSKASGQRIPSQVQNSGLKFIGPSLKRMALETFWHVYWLVVDLPLWKIWARQLGLGWHPIYEMENVQKCLKPPTR